MEMIRLRQGYGGQANDEWRKKVDTSLFAEFAVQCAIRCAPSLDMAAGENYIRPL